MSVHFVYAKVPMLNGWKKGLERSKKATKTAKTALCSPGDRKRLETPVERENNRNKKNLNSQKIESNSDITSDFYKLCYK